MGWGATGWKWNRIHVEGRKKEVCYNQSGEILGKAAQGRIHIEGPPLEAFKIILDGALGNLDLDGGVPAHCKGVGQTDLWVLSNLNQPVIPRLRLQGSNNSKAYDCFEQRSTLVCTGVQQFIFCMKGCIPAKATVTWYRARWSVHKMLGNSEPASNSCYPCSDA